MTTYKFLQIFVLSYSGFIAIFVTIMTSFEIWHRSSVQGKHHFFELLNKLHGRTTILLPFRVLSVLFMISWLALALPLVDLFIGTQFIASFTDVNGWTGLQTWFGIFTDQNNASGYYFGTVFVSILGVKGFWLVKQMADTLTDDTLAVGITGSWGGVKDFKK